MSKTLAIMFEADGEVEDAQAEKECFGGHGGDGKSTQGQPRYAQKVRL